MSSDFARVLDSKIRLVVVWLANQPAGTVLEKDDERLYRLLNVDKGNFADCAIVEGLGMAKVLGLVKPLENGRWQVLDLPKSCRYSIANSMIDSINARARAQV